MTIQIKCKTKEANGFTENKTYSVVGVGETAAVLLNDEGKFSSISYAELNSDAWDVTGEAGQKDSEPKASKSKPKVDEAK